MRFYSLLSKIIQLDIHLENIGKRYNLEWIFRNVNLSFDSNSCSSILGSNGSGKSTLLQIISGYLSQSEGQICWKNNGVSIPTASLYHQVSVATPYLNLYDDFTLVENVNFFLQFKKLRGGISAQEFAERIELDKHIDKQIRFYSSGMRQRLKLGLAILAESSLLLLDEPTSHLDANAINWFQQLLADNAKDRSIFVASNSHEDETFLCQNQIVVEDFKKK